MATYDSGWVSESTWQNTAWTISHGLGKRLYELDVAFYMELTAADLAVHIPFHMDMYDKDDNNVSSDVQVGLSVKEDSSDKSNKIVIQTGHSGFRHMPYNVPGVVPNSAGKYRVYVTDKIGDRGPSGAAGTDGADGADGTTTVVYAPAWDSAVSYAVGDVVFYSGDVYKCIQASTNNQPDTSAAYWEALPKTYTTENEPTAVDGSLWIKE